MKAVQLVNIITFSLIFPFAQCHSLHARQAQRSITRTFTGAPYPTGPGFDVPALADITSGSPPEPTVALPKTFPAGSVPSVLGAGAVGLPDLSAFDASVYPPLDKVPPTDSPQVKEWLKEIEGVTIPNLKPTKDGSCASDPEFASQAGADGRCWWTCGGCVRDTDIEGCQDRERWGLTFDDGPSEYTPKLLTFLQSIDTLATFYLVGSRVVSFPETVQTQVMIGHEVSVHTWSHHPLTSLTNEQVVAELGWSRQAIKDVTGVTPLTFRPPFGDFDDRIRAIANAMNLTPVVWSTVGTNRKADTEDFEVPAGLSTSTETIDQFRNTLAIVEGSADAGIITLEHDLFQETVDLAIGFTLPDAISRPGPLERGWTLGTVAQCRGVPAGDAYRETTTNETVLVRLGRTPTPEPSSTPLAISTTYLPSSTASDSQSTVHPTSITTTAEASAAEEATSNFIHSSSNPESITTISSSMSVDDHPAPLPYPNGHQQPYGTVDSTSTEQGNYPAYDNPSTPSSSGGEDAQQPTPEFLNQGAPTIPVVDEEGAGPQGGGIAVATGAPTLDVSGVIGSSSGIITNPSPVPVTTRASGGDGNSGVNFGVIGYASASKQLNTISLSLSLLIAFSLMAV